MSNTELIKGEIKIKYDDGDIYEGDIYRRMFEGNGKYIKELIQY